MTVREVEGQTGLGIYIIQYSHDKTKWFGCGADAVKSPTEFSLGEVLDKYDWILENWHKPYPATWVRIVSEGLVVRCDQLSGYS